MDRRADSRRRPNRKPVRLPDFNREGLLMFDVILKGGRVVDGSGSPWYLADVGIEGERITAIGSLANAETHRTIDVSGRVVCPGFVDAHVHGDLALLTDPLHRPAIHQGVTTYIIGQDGCGFAPASPKTIQYMRDYTVGFTGSHPQLDYDWSSVDEYLNRFHRKTSLNVAYLIPNGTVRMEVMGLDRREATVDEITAMQKLVRDGMEQGAVGLSTGLDYIPSLYADTEEITALCRAIAPYDGVYVTHVRSAGGGNMANAVEEVFTIGAGSGCLLHISHFNVKIGQYLERVDQARRSGIDITFDTYPYRAGMTFLAMLALPVWAQEDGVDATLDRLTDPSVRRQVAEFYQARLYGSENIMLAGIASEKHRELEGLRLNEAAEKMGQSIPEMICDLLLTSRLDVNAVVFDTSRTDADVVACMTHPCQMACSDGIFWGRLSHPRAYGSFAEYLGKHVRQEQSWTLEQAVSHLSYHACRRFRLADRGLVRRGMIADLAVFDPRRISARSTYEDPKQLAVGVDYVLVGGAVTLENGSHTGVTNGQALRRETI